MSRKLCSNFKNGDWTWELYDELADVEIIWREFEQEAVCHVFQTFDWLSRWIEIVGKPVHAIDPRIVIVRKLGEIELILPLGIRRHRGVSLLEWLGGIHADYQGPLVKIDFNKEALGAVWKLIKKTLPKFDAVFFRSQSGDKDYQGNPFLNSIVTEHARAYSICINGAWEKYQTDRVNPKLRADSRRQKKRLKELGDLKFVVASDHETAKRLTQVMFDQKRRRFKDTNCSDILAMEEYRLFYEKITDDLLTSKMIHVSALEINDQVIASHWGALYRNHFYYLMPAFAGGDWKRYSPGRLLLESLLEWCFNNGVKKFDFTGGAEAYKLDWYNADVPLYEYVNANTLKGTFYLQWRRTRTFLNEFSKGPLAKKIYERFAARGQA